MSARSWRAAVVGCRGAGRWFLATVWLALAGCSSAPDSVLDARTTDGKPVRELVAAGMPTVILHYPPGYCFACGQDLGEWVDHERAGLAKLVILLTEEPSAGTRRALALRRIRVAGVIAPPDGRQVPREYLVENGEVTLATLDPQKTGRNSAVFAAAREQFRAAARTRDDAADPPAASLVSDGS
jgi:hypothetical protein